MVDPNEYKDLTGPGAVAGSADPGFMGTPDPTGDLAGTQPASEYMTIDAAYDPLAGATSGKKLKGSFLVLLAVIIVAAGGLYSMRKFAQSTAAKGIDKDIEETIEKFLLSMSQREQAGAADGSTDRTALNAQALSVITQSYAERQIQLGDVQRDPFRIDALDRLSKVDTYDKNLGGLTPEERRERQRTRLRGQLIDAAETLKLKSIIGGSSPMALIDDEIVHIGDTVSDQQQEFVFRISGISGTSVDLVAEVSELDLVVNISLRLRRNR